MDSNFFQMYSGLEYEEAMMIDSVIKDFSEDDKRKFMMIYRGRRQDPNNVLIFTLLGFVGIAGVHRFVVGDILMGILYLFTAGLCWIGTIVDLINYKSITMSHNRQKIHEVANMIRRSIVSN